MKLYIIAGHGAGDPGACAYGVEEAKCVRALAARIKAYGGDQVEVLDTSRNWYADRGISRLSLPSDAQLVELHMDSADGEARGAHVIYCSRFKPDEYDVKLADFVAGIFPGRANSLVGRSDLRNPNLAASRGISYRLVENGFISSWQDLSTFGERLDDIARGYLEAFGIQAVQEPAEEGPEQPQAVGMLDVDGWWGKQTTRRLQQYFGLPASGTVYSQWAGHEAGNPGLVSGWEWVYSASGCALVRLIQATVGTEQDGIMGPETIKAMQRHFGTPADGVVSGPSPMVKAMQRRLNEGTF